MSPKLEYDVIVLGAGPAGENAAGRCTAGGLTAAIVEPELVGGECSYWACMPSKAILRPGEVLRSFKRTPGVRFANKPAIDLQETLERRDALAAHWDDKYQVRWLDDNKIELFRGTGRLKGEKRVSVTSPNGDVVELSANKAVVVATGTGAAIPPVPGLKEANPWSNREITAVKSIPDRLLIMGGGVVGVEMAQALKDLGADQVTIVELGPSLLAQEERFAGELLADVFRKDYGIKVLVNATTKSVTRNSDGTITMTLSDGDNLTGDEILVAAGRRPHSSDIGLETVGLEPGQYLAVGNDMRVRNVPGDWLYAVGDVNGRSLLTHTGKYQARVAGDVILGKPAEAWGDVKAVPRVVFTDPQIAACGLTSQQAEDSGINARVVEWDFGNSAGAATHGSGIKGKIRIVVDSDRGNIVGATFVGPGAGEMLHAATIAIAAAVPMTTLWHAIPSFPTISEFWLRLMEEYGL